MREAARGEHGMAVATVMLATFALITLATATITMALGSQSLSRHDQDWNGALAAAEGGVDDAVVGLDNGELTIDPLTGQFTSGYPAQAPDHWVTVQNTPTPSGYPAPARFQYSGKQLPDGSIVVTSTGTMGGAARTIQAMLSQQSTATGVYHTNLETKDPIYYINQVDGNYGAWAQNNCTSYYYSYTAPSYRNSSCIDAPFGTGDTINAPQQTNDALSICGSPSFRAAVLSAAVQSSQWGYYNSYAPYWSSHPCPAVSGPPPPPTPPALFPFGLTNTQQWCATCLSTSYYTTAWDAPGNNYINIPTWDAQHDWHWGCVFTGQTSITFNPDGTATVDAPYSQVLSDPRPVAPAGSATAGCPISTPANANARLGLPYPYGAVCGFGHMPRSSATNFAALCLSAAQAAGQQPAGDTSFQPPPAVIPASALKQGIVIYVQNTLDAPLGNSDPNYMDNCRQPIRQGQLNWHALGYGNEAVTGDNVAGQGHYRCLNGDVYLRGDVGTGDRVTVAADNNIIVGTSVVGWGPAPDGQQTTPDDTNGSITVGNLCYAGGTQECNNVGSAARASSLGLIANGDLEIWDPTHGNCGTSTLLCYTPPYRSVQPYAGNGPVIQAVMIAPNHSFLAYNYFADPQPCQSPPCRLEVDGVINQNYRGPTATYTSAGNLSTGFAKLYNSDQGLTPTNQPPDFYGLVNLPSSSTAWVMTAWSEISPRS